MQEGNLVGERWVPCPAGPFGAVSNVQGLIHGVSPAQSPRQWLLGIQHKDSKTARWQDKCLSNGPPGSEGQFLNLDMNEGQPSVTP